MCERYDVIIQELLERKRREFEHIAVFPCKLRIMPNCIFNTRDPIVVGVVVEAGIIKSGTPLTVPSKSVSHSLYLGNTTTNVVADFC